MAALGDDEELAEQLSEDNGLGTGGAVCGGAVHQDSQVDVTGLRALPLAGHSRWTGLLNRELLNAGVHRNDLIGSANDDIIHGGCHSSHRHL